MLLAVEEIVSHPPDEICLHVLGVLLQDLVVEINKNDITFSSDSPCPNNDHRAWIDAML